MKAETPIGAGPESDPIVTKLAGAAKLLAEAKTVQQTKHVIDIAHAAAVYARRQKLGEEAIRHATDLKLDALRKLGGMLRATERAARRRVGRSSRSGVGGDADGAREWMQWIGVRQTERACDERAEQNGRVFRML